MNKSQQITAAAFTLAGILHFIATPTYARIMPQYLSHPALLVQLSGAAEIAGGLGLLFKQTRKPAAWGLIALLIAVLPANIQMAVDHTQWPTVPAWALWLRVPMQFPMVWWVWRFTQD